MPMLPTFASTLFLAVVLLIAGTVLLPAIWGSPWAPLASRRINHILQFAEIQEGETLYDLGSGDGRVLIAAARNHGALGVGIDIDPLKVWIARWLAKRAGVSEQVQFLRKNFFKVDLKEADVVYVYLTHQAMDKLLPAFTSKLKPGARVVSYRFCLRHMTPDKIDSGKNMFLYRMDKGNNVNAYR